MTTSTVKIKNLFLFLLFFNKSFDHITFTIHLVIREDAIENDWDIEQETPINEYQV